VPTHLVPMAALKADNKDVGMSALSLVRLSQRETSSRTSFLARSSSGVARIVAYASITPMSLELKSPPQRYLDRYGLWPPTPCCVPMLLAPTRSRARLVQFRLTAREMLRLTVDSSILRIKHDHSCSLPKILFDPRGARHNNNRGRSARASTRSMDCVSYTCGLTTILLWCPLPPQGRKRILATSSYDRV